MNKHKIINIDLETTPKKYFLKLGKSQIFREKKVHVNLSAKNQKLTRFFKTPNFSFVGYGLLSQKELLEGDFKSKPCCLHQANLRHKPQPLLLSLRAQKNSFNIFFFALFTQPPKMSWGRNFCISWSRGFGLMKSYGNLFVGPFPS